MPNSLPTSDARRTDLAVIILAAGLGTRMKSDKAKVLHKLRGRPMILYVVETAEQVAGDHIILVVGHQADRVRSTVSSHAMVQYAFQKEQLGTGHAVQTAIPFLDDPISDIVILCGDVPLLTAHAVCSLVDDHREKGRDITLLAVDVDDPSGYGRLILDDDGTVMRIVEESDASEMQKRIRTINAGIYCVRKETLVDTVARLRPTNRQKELYLTDIIEIGNHFGRSIGVVFGDDPDQVTGINTVDDLWAAERLMNARSMKKS